MWSFSLAIFQEVSTLSQGCFTKIPSYGLYDLDPVRCFGLTRLFLNNGAVKDFPVSWRVRIGTLSLAYGCNINVLKKSPFSWEKSVYIKKWKNKAKKKIHVFNLFLIFDQFYCHFIIENFYNWSAPLLLKYFKMYINNE